MRNAPDRPPMEHDDLKKLRYLGRVSIEPNDSASQMDGAQEVTCGLVVACSNGAVLLEPGKEVLDQVAGLVQMAVIAALVPA